MLLLYLACWSDKDKWRGFDSDGLASCLCEILQAGAVDGKSRNSKVCDNEVDGKQERYNTTHVLSGSIRY